MSNATENALSVVGKISVDVALVLFCCVALITLGLTKGKDMLFVFLFSLYPTVLVTSFFPFYDMIASGSVEKYLPLIVFVLSFASIFFVFRKYIDTNYQPNRLWRWIEVCTLSVTSIGLCFALLCHSADLHLLYSFSPLFKAIFISPYALFVWLIAPLVSIPILVRG